MTSKSRVYVTDEKEHTKQSNANPLLKCMWCLLEMLGLHLYIRKNNSETKAGEKHNSIRNDEG